MVDWIKYFIIEQNNEFIVINDDTVIAVEEYTSNQYNTETKVIYYVCGEEHTFLHARKNDSYDNKLYLIRKYNFYGDDYWFYYADDGNTIAEVAKNFIKFYKNKNLVCPMAEIMSQLNNELYNYFADGVEYDSDNDLFNGYLDDGYLADELDNYLADELVYNSNSDDDGESESDVELVEGYLTGDMVADHYSANHNLNNLNISVKTYSLMQILILFLKIIILYVVIEKIINTLLIMTEVSNSEYIRINIQMVYPFHLRASVRKFYQ